jgi:hypothetical protein
VAVCAARPSPATRAGAGPLQSFKARLEVGSHFFQPLLKLLILSLELLKAGGKLGKLLLKPGQPARDVGRIAAPLRSHCARHQEEGDHNDERADRLCHASADPAVIGSSSPSHSITSSVHQLSRWREQLIIELLDRQRDARNVAA